ncbi:sulfotransferase [Gloeothece citriformis PCC 7424]|uniref:Sulfotransferase n=1 Tax=Gloeothece citriformis (strain PCC 7424) TaxID=65393 RepID=B7KEJ9_GLOC7|nr:sulfotransferase domain-containing protein [Gloeothece citriformis]ACK69024.1 sulfotransferase [Gloeothece citriformis PCC 7424]
MLKKAVKQIVYPIIQSTPDFLIIGTQKGGTTSLYNYLIEHPQIIGNKSWKEIRYYDLAENYNQGFSWYLGQFPSKLKKGNRLTFDASPSYLYFPNIPKLIQQDLGHIKMIAILRNPVDRAYSAWKMYSSFGTNPNVYQNIKKLADKRTFAQAIEQELTNTCQPGIYFYDYVNRGKYVEQIKNYYKYFEQNTLLILTFDELKQNVSLVMNKICEFLNIEPYSQEALKQFKSQKFNVGLKDQENFSSEDEEYKQKLKTYFEPYNQKLYELLGYSCNW